MKKPRYLTRKAFYNYLSFSRTKDPDAGYECGRGFYITMYGETVSIYSHSGFRTIESHTNMEYRVDGIEHVKVYNRTFNDKGLMMVSKAFIDYVNNL